MEMRPDLKPLDSAHLHLVKLGHVKLLQKAIC